MIGPCSASYSPTPIDSFWTRPNIAVGEVLTRATMICESAQLRLLIAFGGSGAERGEGRDSDAVGGLVGVAEGGDDDEACGFAASGGVDA